MLSRHLSLPVSPKPETPERALIFIISDLNLRARVLISPRSSVYISSPWGYGPPGAAQTPSLPQAKKPPTVCFMVSATFIIES
ncbi:hypothetical protein BaRGS_00034610 [Batillaria attramentaria]|uniref:Uncharacterized protein n=1 Tax=Batillaria attramentaria TaxID=370345 RepID=A0ABD0JHH2_9CAEN